MDILITGSNGIIGEQFVSQLLREYPAAKLFVINRTPSVIKDERIESIEQDLLNTTKEQLDSIFDRTKPELFFHFAWDTNHTDYLNTPNNIKWEEVSIILINSFYRSGGKRFIGVGSSIEYDWEQNSPFEEDASPLSGNKWLYGQYKLNVYKYLAAQKGISYLWCRVFFVFGPNQSKSRLVPKIINNVLYDNSPLSLNLTLKRDYISTFEIARQILMMQKTDFSGAVNICSGRAVELGYIANCITDIIKKPLKLSPVKYQDGFEIESLGGSLKLINRFYKEYEYSLDNFYEDIKKTIDAIACNNHS